MTARTSALIAAQQQLQKELSGYCVSALTQTLQSCIAVPMFRKTIILVDSHGLTYRVLYPTDGGTASMELTEVEFHL